MASSLSPSLRDTRCVFSGNLRTKAGSHERPVPPDTDAPVAPLSLHTHTKRRHTHTHQQDKHKVSESVGVFVVKGLRER